MSGERFDELVTALARTRPVLDDITRARVGAVLATAGRAPEPVRRPRHRLRWMLAAGAAAAAAAVVTSLILRDTAPSGTAAPKLMVVAGELPEGAILSAEPGTSVRGQVSGAAVTVYGPGWAIRRRGRIVVEADAIVVDRPGGDTAIDLRMRTGTIHVLHATFSVDGSDALRVTVIRGEIVLSCDGMDVDQPVNAGGSATCSAPRTAVRRRAPGAPEAPGRPVGEPAPAPPTPAAPAIERSAPPRSPPPEAPPPARAIAAAPPASPGELAPPPSAIAAAPPASPGELAPPPPSAIAAAGPQRARAAAVDAPRPAPPVAAPASPLAPPDLAARYAAAEQLVIRDRAAGQAALRALVVQAPGTPESASALLDLARLAAAAGDDAAARTALDRLATHPRADWFAMPAAYLRCTLEHSDPEWRACLVGFRTEFPGSSRDAEALAHLAIATARAGDCDAAVPLLVEFRERYPNGPSDADVRAWTARCDHVTVLR